MAKSGPKPGAPNAGRPPIKLDINELREFLKMPRKLSDCAAKFSVSEDTIQRHVAKHTGKTYAVFADECLFSLRSQLQGEAVRLALGLSLNGKDKVKDGEWRALDKCLDNICGWADKVEQKNFDGDAQLTDEQLKTKIESMISQRKK